MTTAMNEPKVRGACERVSLLPGSGAIVGGRHILSIASGPDDPSWLIVNLVHDELADRLTVEFLGQDDVSQDIELGRVEGEVISFEGKVDSELTASTTGLRSYFSQYGQAFTDSILVLERVSGEAE